jgi:hypothetical protein
MLSAAGCGLVQFAAQGLAAKCLLDDIGSSDLTFLSGNIIDTPIDFGYLCLHSSIFIKFAFHFFHRAHRDVYLDSPIETAHSEPW